MDDPALERAQHEHALRGLARINALSAAWRPLLAALRAPAWQRERERPLRVLDVASGSGDVPLAMAKRFPHAAWYACDVSQQAMDVARERAGAAGVQLQTFRCDAVGGKIAGPEQIPARFDVVMCSLFVHHLEPSGVRALLTNMAMVTDGLLLVHDLRRTRAGIALAHVVPKLLTRSRVVHVDAVKSVYGAYTMQELAALAREAGLEGAVLTATFPQRMLLAWKVNRQRGVGA
jgi:2-polyprenyl-3-methyl-5-hydroxy-6-metoxy-1,4-benzoquinol methylase